MGSVEDNPPPQLNTPSGVPGGGFAPVSTEHIEEVAYYLLSLPEGLPQGTNAVSVEDNPADNSTPLKSPNEAEPFSNEPSINPAETHQDPEEEEHIFTMGTDESDEVDTGDIIVDGYDPDEHDPID